MHHDEPQKNARKSRRGQITREKIIEVAESLIAIHGPDGFQLQNVTELLGITPPAIYNHFKDREDLVAHIAERGGRLLSESMRRRPGDDTLTSLRRNARRYVDFLVENPAHARLILWDLARRGTTAWRGHASSNLEIRDRMSAAFDVAAARGEIRPVPLDNYLQFLYVGAAAAVVWTDTGNPLGSAGHPPSPAPTPTPTPSPAPDARDADGNERGHPAPLRAAEVPSPYPPLSAIEVERLKDRVEDLAVRLLSPALGEIED